MVTSADAVRFLQRFVPANVSCTGATPAGAWTFIAECTLQGVTDQAQALRALAAAVVNQTQTLFLAPPRAVVVGANPLATNATTPTPTPAPAGGDGGLSNDAIIGISVGCGVLAIIVIIAVYVSFQGHRHYMPVNQNPQPQQAATLVQQQQTHR